MRRENEPWRLENALPSRQELLVVARSLDIPPACVEDFIRDMKEIGYKCVDGRGCLVTLNKHNFALLLGAYHLHRAQGE